MTADRHPTWYRVVRLHWRKTTGFLLATRDPCLETRNKEIHAVTGRNLVALDLDQLEEWEPPESWILGVLLCPGDSTDQVAQWVQRRRADPSRVWFFVHPDAKQEAFAPWQRAGLPLEHVDYVADWKPLHPFLGLALNDQVYADWHKADEE